MYAYAFSFLSYSVWQNLYLDYRRNKVLKQVGGFMAQYDGSIRINTLLNTSGLRRGEEDMRGSMGRISNAARKMASIITAAFAVGKIVQFGKESLEAASDFEAMESQFSQVFGELEGAASESLSRVAGQAGIMEDRMKSSFTKIAAFAKTTGMNTADSLALSERAMVAVADSAAFYDRSLEETTEYLQSFLKGNYENDAALGLSATEFTRNAAANKLYGTSFIELSEAQKQLTLLQMVEDANRLSGAMGQAAREADTWTNQTGNLNQAWSNLKANIGKFILPIAINAVKSITNVINAINAMLAKLYTAASAFRAFSELITGKKSQAGTSSGISKDAGADIGAGYNEAAEGAENLAAANDKAAKSAGKAEKAAKGQLSALDKLNNLSSQNSGSGSGGSGGGGTGGGIGGAIEDVDYGKVAEGETQFEKLGGVLDSIIAKIKELAGLFKKGFFEGFGDYKPRLTELKNDILSIGKTLKEIFTDSEVVAAANRFAEQLAYSLGQITGSIASIGLTIAQLLVGGIEKYLTQNAERIKQYIISMFDIGTDISAIIGNFSVAFADIFSVFGGDTAQQIAGNLIGIFVEVGMMISENAAKLGRDILNMITQPIIDNKDKIKESLEGILQAIEPFTSGLLDAVQKVRDAVTEIYDEHLKPLFDSIANGLSEILEKLLDGYNTYMLPVLQGLGDKFKEIMEGPFGETIDKVKDFIGKLIDAVKLLWENVLVPFFSWIANNVYPVLAPIVDFIGNTVLSVFDTIIDVIGNIAESLGGVIDFVVGVFTGDWKKAWEGIKQFFKGTWDTISDILSMNWDFIKNIVKNGVELVKALITAAWERIKTTTSIVWNAIKGVVSTVWNGMKALASTIFNILKTTISNAWNVIKTVTSTVWNAIKSFVSGIWNGLKSLVSSVFNGIKSVISTVWNTVKTVTSNVWNGIKGTVSNIWNGLKNSVSSIFNGIKDTITNIWDSIKSSTENIWNGIRDAIKTPINAIIGFLNSMISGIASGINGLTGMLNKLKIDIPKGVPLVGGMNLGFNIPKINPIQIPYLATGAVIPANKEFLAVLGDQKHGRNLEAPEDLIRKIVREESAKGNQGGGEITIKIPVEIDGRVLFELMKKFDLEQFNRTGRPSFQI